MFKKSLYIIIPALIGEVLCLQQHLKKGAFAPLIVNF